ncbi:MFS transporter [Corynebacterium poyangense]|uniref:MFS transporter n=1 Tax=Corynebacterium poyangense TaxID=2684405 RepID=A0A7H0SRX8_9CORY|nr:MFS transporter [Corynebacterium poyangense]MBZ8177245.1 MFS transporter [Corynebacterium poyangense]QNQ91303.1 MFS transporter [Corynebacterium poyangense]
MNSPTATSHRLTAAGRRALIAAITGSLIEWYDYALYGAAAAVVIGPLFFNGSPIGAQLASFATFAVGFLARPLGGIVIGHIGDRYGRRPAMLIAILMMGFATVAIGLLPTTAVLGSFAPALLVLFRLIQGLGAGAELAGAMTIVAEFAPPHRRGLLTSLVLATPPTGIVVATGAFLLAASQGDEILLGWAWRIPFLISILLFALAVFIRHKLEETPEYVAAMAHHEEKKKDHLLPLNRLISVHPIEVLLGFLSVTGHNALNYTMAVYALSFMTSPDIGMSRSSALTAVMVGTLFGTITTPAGGIAADRLGASRVLALGSGLGALFAFPLMFGLASGSLVWATLVIALGYGVIIAMTSGAQGAFLASLFPPAERYSGIALARELNGAIVAGFTPLILTWVRTHSGNATFVPALAIALCLATSCLAVVVGGSRARH